jgi:hypothetical protein
MERDRRRVTSGVSRVVSAVGGLAGRVLGAVAGFGSLLVGAGAALIQGLINGVTSRIGA